MLTQFFNHDAIDTITDENTPPINSYGVNKWQKRSFNILLAGDKNNKATIKSVKGFTYGRFGIHKDNEYSKYYTMTDLITGFSIGSKKIKYFLFDNYKYTRKFVEQVNNDYGDFNFFDLTRFTKDIYIEFTKQFEQDIYDISQQVFMNN